MATIFVPEAPQILQLIQKTDPRSGHRSLHYRVFGWPPPTTSWLFNGRQRNNTLWHDGRDRGDPRGVVVGGRMLLARVNSLEGNYTLVVSNSQGNVSRCLRVELRLGQVASGESRHHLAAVLTLLSLLLVVFCCFW